MITTVQTGRLPLSCIFVLFDSRHERASRTVPPCYDFRLEDLRAFHLVRAHCQACGHKAVIPNAALMHGRPATPGISATRLKGEYEGADSHDLTRKAGKPRLRTEEPDTCSATKP
jgi:hypothetical protein